jgi:VanZ family protein
MSTLNDNSSPSAVRSVRAAAWILASAIVVLSLVPSDLRPETDLPHHLEHFLIFFITGCAFGLGYSRTLGRLATLLVLFAGLVEIAQLLQPSRHARISDFLIDTFALWVGLMAVSLSNEFWTRFGNSNGPRQN